jgi:hypothetical protein
MTLFCCELVSLGDDRIINEKNGLRLFSGPDG